jgi:hypothetical protein
MVVGCVFWCSGLVGGTDFTTGQPLLPEME